MTGGVVNKLVDTLSKKGVNHEGISMIEDHIGRNVSLARSKIKRFTVPSTSVLFMAPEANCISRRANSNLIQFTEDNTQFI